MSNQRVQAVLSSLDKRVDDSEVLPESHEVDASQLLMYSFRNSPVGIVFEGDDTEECRLAIYNDLVQRDCLKEAINELMIFTRRSCQTIRRWILGEVIPQRTDWLKWQYWLRAKGYRTRELDCLPNSFFQLRKHIISGDISFAEVARALNLANQETLWAMLNNEVSLETPEGREWMIFAIGSIHLLVADINRRITEQELIGYLEVDLNIDGDFSEVKQRYGIGNQSRVQPDAVAKLVQQG